MAAPKALLSSAKSTWITPERYIEAARRVMGSIELDPASSDEANKIVKADRYFTPKEDGLAQDWIAGTVWLNPPYGYMDINGKQASSVAVWVNKMLAEFRAGHFDQCILLINNNTEAAWFQQLWGYPMCFTDHRIRFLDPDDNAEQSAQPTRGNVFVYLSSADMFQVFDPWKKLSLEFEQFGHITS